MGRADGTITITARQLEALVRLSEASARLRLNRVVEESDAKRAVGLVEYYLSEFASSNGGLWDMSAIDSNYTKRDRDRNKTVMRIIDMFGSSDGISLEEILVHASNDGMTDDEVKKILRNLATEGMLFNPRADMYKRA
jgi:replicative DNA helicase Mcm